MITFDEHGGCYDHVEPPPAKPPDAASDPGEEGFHFDRYGVRVPTVLVSPYIEAGTVFRSPIAVPYDHNSILATLRDWLQIPQAQMPPSNRVKNAPGFANVLTRSTPRPDIPVIGVSEAAAKTTTRFRSLERFAESDAKRPPAALRPWTGKLGEHGEIRNPAFEDR